MDRPSRKTKVVNYCEAKDLDDDEDFACAKGPPRTKKAKEGVEQMDHKKSLRKSSSQETNGLSRKSSKQLEDNLRDRDLEAAITLSLLNNADGIKERSFTSKGEIHLPAVEKTDPSLPRLSDCSVDSTILGLDEILSDKELSAKCRQRRPATKPVEEQTRGFKGEDEDYRPKLAPDSESDDEGLTVKKVGKTKKENVNKRDETKRPPASKKEKKPSKPKWQAAVSAPVRSPPAAKAAPKRPASLPAVSVSPAGGRIPKWNPPGQIGEPSRVSSHGPVAKSPGQGLRLGLSRLVRVKPLHPSVASH